MPLEDRIHWRCDACGATGCFKREATDTDHGYERMLALHRQQSPACRHDDRLRVRVGDDEVYRRAMWMIA
jgi:hypothetical protein